MPLDQMETSWLGGRVPMLDLREMIQGALSPNPKPMGPDARFGYPLLAGDPRLNARVEAVSLSRRTVTLTDGTTYR